MRKLAMLAVLVLPVLASCAPGPALWSEAQSPKRNRVEAVRLTHDLPLASPNAPLGAADIAALDAFLARHRIGEGDAILVAAGGSGAAAARNVGALLQHLSRQGLEARAVEAAAPPNAVRVTVDRFVVVPPHCPDWRKPGTSDFANTPLSNLGCANAVNLGMMIANPRDLVQGQEPGAIDGTAASLAVQRYRTDKIKPLDKSGTTQ